MANSSVAVTPGAGATVDTYQLAGGDHQQFVREAPATAFTAPSSWTILATSVASVLALDESRRTVILTNASSSATVYLRYDTGTVSAAAGGWHDQIGPGGRLFVEKENVTMPISMLGTVAIGYVEIALGTAA